MEGPHREQVIVILNLKTELLSSRRLGLPLADLEASSPARDEAGQSRSSPSLRARRAELVAMLRVNSAPASTKAFSIYTDECGSAIRVLARKSSPLPRIGWNRRLTRLIWVPDRLYWP
jgi:hypothetical protein